MTDLSGSRKTSTCRWSPPTTCTTRTPTTPRRTRSCCACSPGRRSPTPTASSSTRRSSTSRRPAQMRAALPRPPRGVRQHAADRRAVRGRVRHGRELHAALPGARPARPRRPGSSRRSRRASTTATRPASPTRCARRPSTRSASSPRWASPATSSSSPTSSTGRKNNGIRVGPGRGSGAGSMAAYAMSITDLDPLRHGLIFERFLNPDRVSMPDFDVDFDERRRGEVIRYVTEKYGDERVAQIVTYGTIKAKQALKDSGRVLGFPFSMGEKLTKAMPPAVMGKDIPLGGILDSVPRALQGGGRHPRPARDRPRGAHRLRHRARPRGPQAPVGRARGRRDHVERAAHRHHPDHEAASRTARSSPSSTTRRPKRSA